MEAAAELDRVAGTAESSSAAARQQQHHHHHQQQQEDRQQHHHWQQAQQEDRQQHHQQEEDRQQEDRRADYTRLVGQANLDPVRNTRYLLQILRQVAVFAGICALIETALLIFFLFLGITGIGLTAALKLETGSLGLVSLALVIVFWILPVPALLGQWGLLLEHSSGATQMAFQHISAALDEHQAPLDSLRVRAVSPPGEGQREYLELRRDNFSGLISCFPHGDDLYVGWTFWLRMSPSRLLLTIIGRTIHGLTGRGDDIHQTLRFESTRALVAAMHSATLAGIDSAATELDPDGPRLGNAVSDFRLG